MVKDVKLKYCPSALLAMSPLAAEIAAAATVAMSLVHLLVVLVPSADLPPKLEAGT